MSSLYLEHYLESVETLPGEIHRNFNLMRELDEMAEADGGKLDTKCAQFLATMNSLSVPDRKRKLSSVQDGYKRMLDLSDQKVALAVQTYELVDQHIRNLDSDLKKFEEETASQSLKRDDGRKRKKERLMEGDSAFVNDMPVDPNEPTYCLCHQVSYGEMIGCDNPDCPTEWFHFACVNLKAQPKGEWFCPQCRAVMDRKKTAS